MQHTHCGHCHTCGATQQWVLDGEEWCPQCGQYRRYKAHGWGTSGEGAWTCPERIQNERTERFGALPSAMAPA